MLVITGSSPVNLIEMPSASPAAVQGHDNVKTA